MVLGFVLPVAQRLEKAKLLASKGVYFPSLCSDEVRNTWGVRIGNGVLIHKSSVITPGVTIDHFVGINSGAHIEESTIGMGCIITPNVFIGEGSRIGQGTIIYPNTTVLPKTTIGDHCVIGANEVVHADIPSGARYFKGKVHKDILVTRI